MRRKNRALKRIYWFPIAGRSLALNPLLAVIGVAMFALLVSLGNWQTDRAQFKEARLSQYSAQTDSLGMAFADAIDLPADPYSRIWARGEFKSDAPLLFLDNRTRRGMHGFHVLAVFEAEGVAQPVLVNLGWIAQKQTRKDLPIVELPSGPVDLSALFTHPPMKVFRLGPDEPPVSPDQWIIQAVEIGDLADRLGYGLAPFVLLLRPEQSFGLVREWKPVYVVTPEKHRGYAFQWYSLAVAWVGLLIWASLRKGQPSD